MKKLTQLREESNAQTRMLWHSSFYDGPQSGMMLWNGEMMWFSMYDEKYTEILMPDDEWQGWVEYYKKKHGTEPDEEDRIEFDRTRYFKVYKLPSDVKDSIIHNHKLFQTYVGLHTDYNLEGRLGKFATMGDLKPYINHRKFYSAKHSDNWLVRLFPRFFKKENLYMKYKLELEKYEVIDEFEN